MTRTEIQRRAHLDSTLASLGFTVSEAARLRRISSTLNNWYALECGTDAGAIERDPDTEKPYFICTQEQPEYRVYRLDDVRETLATRQTFATYALAKLYAATVNPGPAIVRAIPPRRWPVADREKGAIKRLEKTMSERNARNDAPLSYYLQTDPRGEALYILRPGDVPSGKSPAAYYTNGICVF
jgi:hypothetical protein